MIVYQVVLGSAWIALGAWVGVRSVLALTLGRAQPQMSTVGARSGKWRLLGSAAVSCLLGISLLIDANLGDAVRWLLGTAATALLVWFLGSDLGAWRRSRRQRNSSQQQA